MADNNIDDLKQAYEADKERKLVREEELQAARDYLGVILKEAEGTSRELEGKRKEADLLAERLSKTESEISELKKENEKHSKQNKWVTVWMVVSLLELLIIGGLIFTVFLKGNKENDVPDDTASNVSVAVGDSQGSDNSDAKDTMELSKATSKYNENLDDFVKYVSFESIAPFTVFTDKIGGLEYLVFEAEGLRVCYKNEYFENDLNYRKEIIIDNGDVRYSFSRNYDITKDVVELRPGFTTIAGVKYLVFTDYSGNDVSGIPGSLRLVSCKDFRMYECNDLKAKVNALMKVEALSEVSGFEDASCVISLSTSKSAYKYAISEADYTDIQYYEYEMPEIESDFKFEATEDGISWQTYVKLGTDYYLGMLSGDISVKDSGLAVSGVKYGAFVLPNQEDPELNGYIRPFKAVPERFVTVMGNGGERFFIPVSTNVDSCSYAWENLNTEDPNNWVYLDSDGNKASWRGIDVSKYQADIDWKKVADAGVEFAIVRLGFRGMNEGTLELDAFFEKNMKGAAQNGIKLGVYFFSQAVNDEEAVEEANYVLEALKPYSVEYPVIIDTERVPNYNARANVLSMGQRTDICRIFCDMMAENGYKPMIYANTKYMLMGIDQEKLNDYDKWFAVYSDKITYPYDFEILQYTDKGSIPGIVGNVDLDISFVDYSKKD